MRVVCFFRGHDWVIRPFPSRYVDGWKYGHLPTHIIDPLIWRIEYEECSRGDLWRWRFSDKSALSAYSSALAIAKDRP